MANDVNGVNSAFYNAAVRASNTRKSNTEMSVDSFLQLLAAQLANQDMMNPMQDIDFMGQLAQFTALEMTQETNRLNATAYAVSLVGKEATGATIDKNGDLVAKTGTIEGVGLYNGDPVFYIDGFGFYLGQLMGVGEIPINKPPEDGDGDGDGDENEDENKPDHLPSDTPGQLPI